MTPEELHEALEIYLEKGKLVDATLREMEELQCVVLPCMKENVVFVVGDTGHGFVKQETQWDDTASGAVQFPGDKRYWALIDVQVDT